MRAALLALFLAAPALAQVNTERMRRAFDSDTLVVSLDASAAVARGNTDFLQVGAGARADIMFGGDHLAFLVGRVDLARTDAAAFVDRSFAHARHTARVGAALAWETFVQAERNGPQRLRARTLAGAGLRVEALDRDSLGLAVGLTPMVEHEVLDPALDDPTTALRLSSYLAGRALWPGAALTATAYVQPRASAPGDVRVLGQAALEVHVTGALRLTVRADLRVDSRPPEGVERADVRVENGLALRFGAG